jgi:hypothetical protein
MYSQKVLSSSIVMMLFSLACASSSEAYTEDFDDLNASSRWTAYKGQGFDISTLAPLPLDTNFDRLPFVGGVNGVNDDLSGFAFDYSTVGIPPAPNSAGGSTIGMKLQANLFSNVFGGFSASPNGLNLTGNYTVSFDAWSNTVGPFPGGGSGSTNLSTFGILTSGSFSQSILSSDGVFFAYTGDGNSAADVRAYSVEDLNAYDGTAGEPHATYHAGSRNGNAALYQSAFGTNRAAPQAQTDLFPNQTGQLLAGSAAFAWNHHEIKKTDELVEWFVNGYLLISVDTTNFALPTQGGNISFGHTDINAASSQDPNSGELLFTLIDNITATPEPGSVTLLGVGIVGLLTSRRRIS